MTHSTYLPAVLHIPGRTTRRATPPLLSTSAGHPTELLAGDEPPRSLGRRAGGGCCGAAGGVFVALALPTGVGSRGTGRPHDAVRADGGGEGGRRPGGHARGAACCL